VPHISKYAGPIFTNLVRSANLPTGLHILLALISSSLFFF